MDAAVIPSSAISIDASACLGAGAVGAVFKARYANETVVVKKLKLTSLSQRSQEEFKQEALTLSKLNHPRIVRFLGVVMDQNQYSIVLEYLHHGSLYGFYTSNPKLPFGNRLSLAMDITSGMDFLHRLSPPVLHRDVKSLNMLLYVDSVGELHAKLTDFGISVVMQGTMTSALNTDDGNDSQKGTLLWMAPELFSLRAIYRPSCDVYSFGIVLTELFSWSGPFGIPISEIRHEVLQHHLTVKREIPEIELDEDHPNDKLLALVTECCSYDPSLRPSFPEILETLQRIAGDEEQPVPALELDLKSEVASVRSLMDTTAFDVTETSMTSRTGGSASSLIPGNVVETSIFDVTATNLSSRAGSTREASLPYSSNSGPQTPTSIPRANTPLFATPPTFATQPVTTPPTTFPSSYTPANPPAFHPAVVAPAQPFQPSSYNTKPKPIPALFPSSTATTKEVPTTKPPSSRKRILLIALLTLILMGLGIGVGVALGAKSRDQQKGDTNRNDQNVPSSLTEARSATGTVRSASVTVVSTMGLDASSSLGSAVPLQTATSTGGDSNQNASPTAPSKNSNNSSPQDSNNNNSSPSNNNNNNSNSNLNPNPSPNQNQNNNNNNNNSNSNSNPSPTPSPSPSPSPQPSAQPLQQPQTFKLKTTTNQCLTDSISLVDCASASQFQTLAEIDGSQYIKSASKDLCLKDDLRDGWVLVLGTCGGFVHFADGQLRHHADDIVGCVNRELKFRYYVWGGYQDLAAEGVVLFAYGGLT
ncbi:hypothetical protein HDU97_007606 [Phlyctochytrium planicorne]|nr:hypothetical protein HDU97_007606 [Phlyctochytrium planicorne]